ncbi:MAG: 3-deoxy-manno-octulosonate cytidylyltransferase [Desulfobacteraceae bacterium]|nr:3-deoxy-manno-octulosonate cytidylyltransferase [Desulfobacteraceae bacterium]
MRIVAVIPSRFGSTRFEGKPLALIAGKSMIHRVYDSAKQARYISEVAVATDDQRIYNAVQAFGGKVLMTSVSHRSGTDRVAEAAELLGLGPDEIAINVQGDQPLVHPDCFDAVVEPLLKDPTLGMSTLGYEITDRREYYNPKDCKLVMDQQGYALYFSRAAIPFARDGGDHFPVYKHLGVYAYTRRFLDIFRQLPTGLLEELEKLEQLRALEYGHRIKVILSPHDSPEVDLPEDIPRIEKLIQP